MLYLIVIGVFMSGGAAFWLVQHWMGRGYAHYQSAFKMQAGQGLSDMFLFLDPAQVWSASLFMCGITVVMAYVLTSSMALACAVAAAVLMLPSYLLRFVRRRRLRSLDQQLPELLLGLAGALRAGSGLQAALRHIVEHTSAPLSQELALMLREQRMGVSFEDALHNLHRRIPTEGASLLVSALNIASQSGGSLAETLEQIASTLRARLHLLGRVRALTSQGRMQAWIMAALPVTLAMVLQGLDPDAMNALWHTPQGWAVLLVIAVLEISGLLLIRRIVNIDV